MAERVNHLKISTLFDCLKSGSDRQTYLPFLPILGHDRADLALLWAHWPSLDYWTVTRVNSGHFWPELTRIGPI